jgi:RES domain-containing protein
VITAWRLVRPEFAEDAFSGDGAVLYAGRWHSEGTRVVYTAQSAALATLEMIVHMPRGHASMPAYILIPCYFHEALVEEIDVATLPANWFADISPPELREYGDTWVRDRVSPVLKVPSAVTRIEFNYILNPEHPDFGSVDIGEPREFELDKRLVT